MTTHVNESTQTPDRALTAALAGSAAASAAVPVGVGGPGNGGALAEAARAWRWVVGTQALDLYAVQAASPHWRATCVGAGGALHRARVALAAEGLEAHVTLLPGASDRGSHAAPADRARGAALGRGRRGAPPETPHLARLVVTGTIEITDEARALYDATDQGGPIAIDQAGALATARTTGGRTVDDRATGGRTPDNRVVSDRTAVDPTGDRTAVDPTTGDRTAGDQQAPVTPRRGVARELVRAARAEGVRLRLIRDGREYIGVMHGPDTGEAWLRAGMAFSAVKLLARRLGLQTVAAVAGDDHAPPLPPSPARPDRQPRSGMRRIGDREGWLSVGIGTPYLRLRLAPVPH